MTAKSFVDTNVVLYTIGSDARKKQIARHIVGTRPALSSQVINECVSVSLRKLAFSREQAYAMDVWLRSWRPIDALPYKVHTNRELALMLAGVKPLAVFDAAPADTPDDEDSPERYFAPHVASGRFIRREHTYLDGRRQVFYALPVEACRIDAYIQLLETAQTAGWSEDFERMQGTLLGYEDWQNDAYIETVYRRGAAGSPTG